MQTVRMLEMPDCKMVTSGKGMFGEEAFDAFDAWFSTLKRGLFPKDFLIGDETGFTWLYMAEDGLDVPDRFQVIDFQGGLYAVTPGIDKQTDHEKRNAEVDLFLAQHGLERDPSRPEMGHIITSPTARDILGYEQMDYYTPVRKKA